MPSRRLCLLVATACLVTVSPAFGAVAASSRGSAPAAATSRVDGSTTVTYDVPTRRGTLHLEVVHPTWHGSIVRAPAILTYSPYSVLGRNGDAGAFVPHGYARMYADVVGTGDSGGCYDYGGLGEQESGHDLIEWVAAQRWSTGKVGMIGGSYDGTTQYAAAITHPRHLTTIIPEAAISRWYDYAYSGGMRYTDSSEQYGKEGLTRATDEGADTPAGFDFGFAIPPPTDVTDPNFAVRVRSKLRVCQQADHTLHGYSTTPTYDAFWRERDYVSRLPTVTIPVLVASNWGDYNVKQVESWDAYHALTHSRFRRYYMGTRWAGHGTPPGSAYGAVVQAWFAHYLQGADNGLEHSLPPVTTQTSDSSGPGSYTSGAEPRTRGAVFAAATDGTLVSGPAPGTGTRSFTITGTGTEAARGADYTDGGGAAGFLAFVSAPLTHDLHYYGEPVVTVRTTTGRSFLGLTPALLDVDPATRRGSTATTGDAVVAIDRGWLDSRYRQGLDRVVGLPAGKPFAFTVALKPSDYIVRKGHRLVLLVQSEELDWAAATPDATCARADCATWTVGTGGLQTTVTFPEVLPPSTHGRPGRA